MIASDNNAFTPPMSEGVFFDLCLLSVDVVSNHGC